MVIRVGSSPILHTKKAFFCKLQKNAFFRSVFVFYIILPRRVRKAADSAAIAERPFFYALCRTAARVFGKTPLKKGFRIKIIKNRYNSINFR